MSKFIKPTVLIGILLLSLPIAAQNIPVKLKSQAVLCGADRHDEWERILGGRRVALVGNKSSVTGGQHLLDVLLAKGINVVKVFSPEHGFRGYVEAGAEIDNHVDPSTGLAVISLYGKSRELNPEDIRDVEVIVFDLQDVGVRFYTYISTLHYVMKTAAESGVGVVVLDRPNPNAFLVDGPIREPGFESFVGMHPIPVAHGMTIGEYARMINGEGWLGQGLVCGLEVVSCLHYDHQTEYILPVAPSPNLPNQVSVYLYPSLCFFEGTKVSIGRGTALPFQVFGHPDLPGEFTFRPEPVAGASLNPKLQGQLCHGYDLRVSGTQKVLTHPVIHLEWIIQAWEELKRPDDFFLPYFDTLAGTDQVRLQIMAGKTAGEIRAGWQDGLGKFKIIREKYLLY